MTVYGQIGSSAQPLGALNINTTGDTELSGAVYAASLNKAGSGRTDIDGGLVSTSGAQTYGGGVELGGDTTLASTVGGDIDIAGAISNDAQSNLTVSATNGNIGIGGNFAVGTNSYGPTPIGDVTLNASGAVTLGSSSAPIQADVRSLTVNAGSFDASTSTTSFTCAGTLSATGLCTTGGTRINVSGASELDGPISGPGGLEKNGDGKLIITGQNSYTGDTAVDGGILEIGGNGSLGGGTYGGNINVIGQLRDNSSTNQTLTGAISGPGFINDVGSGTLTLASLSNANHYNFTQVYVLPDGSTTSAYGSTPTLGYALYTNAGGTTAYSDTTPTGTASLTGAPTSTRHVGNYAVSYAGGLSFASERYYIVNGSIGTWQITPRTVTLTASKPYDGSSLFSGAAVSGAVNGDTLPARLNGNIDTGNANAGSYAVSSSALSLVSSDYQLPASFTANITKVLLTVTPDAQTRLYGQANPTFTETMSGFVNGENASVVAGNASGSTAATSTSGVGTYAIKGSVAGLSAANYDFTATTGTLTIGKAHLSVTADNQTRLYGQANPAFTQTVTGFVNGEDASVLSGAPGTASSTATAGTGVGRYGIAADAGTLSASNYDFTPVQGTLTIDKAHLTVTADKQTRLYGQDNPAFTQTITGFVNGETVSVLSGSALGTSTASSASGVGSYVITAGTGTLGSANYDFATANGTLTVDKAHLIVTADNQARLYGQDNPTLTQTITGFANGEDASVLAGSAGIATTAATRTSAQGIYVITASTGTLASANYDFGAADGVLSVRAAVQPPMPPVQTGLPIADPAAPPSPPPPPLVLPPLVVPPAPVTPVMSNDPAATGTTVPPPVADTSAVSPVDSGHGIKAPVQKPPATASNGGIAVHMPKDVVSDAGSEPAPETRLADGSLAIKVTVLLLPNTETSGTVAVSVPRDIASSGSFRFAVPDQAFGRAAGGPIETRLASGAALPGWLRFDAPTRSFVVSGAPESALPIVVRLILQDGLSTLVTITATDH